ncbi:methyltransferase [Dactylosporangium cerinum]
MLKGFNMSFTSDNGVFSKNTVDFGSRLLIESFELETKIGKSWMLVVVMVRWG